MPKESKAFAVAEIKDKLTGSTGVIMADYRGLSVKEMQELRIKVSASGGQMKVFKNTLTEIAMREIAFPDMGELLSGPTVLVFVDSDPVGPAKALSEFAKNHSALEIKGGFVQNALINVDGIRVLAALPSREELVAKLMGTMLNPIRGFMAMANAPVGAFARVVKAVADQKAAA